MPGRRSFLALLTGALGAAMAAVVAVPGLGYLLAPARRRLGEAAFVPLLPLAQVPTGGAVLAEVTGAATDAWTRTGGARLGSVWLRRAADGELRCFSTACPHLGCAVDWDAARNRFACPCHRSAFAADGQPLEGPAPRGLDPLETRVIDGVVEVRFVRYRTGTAERELA